MDTDWCDDNTWLDKSGNSNWRVTDEERVASSAGKTNSRCVTLPVTKTRDVSLSHRRSARALGSSPTKMNCLAKGATLKTRFLSIAKESDPKDFNQSTSKG